MYFSIIIHGFPHRSPGAWLLNPPSSPLVGDKQPVREVSPQSSSQEEPVGMNQTPPILELIVPNQLEPQSALLHNMQAQSLSYPALVQMTTLNLVSFR